MDKEKALALINSLEVIDSDGDGEVLYYALVEDSEANRKTLKKAGITDNQISDAIGNGGIDLSCFVWDYAEWFDGESFLAKRPSDL